MGADVFGGQLVGLEKCRGGFPDVAALRAGSSDVDEEAGLALGR